MQCTFRIVLIIVFLSFLCFSQNINISGTVTDSGGAGIEGAVIQLEKHGYKNTTGANGSFIITGIVGINNQLNQSFPDRISTNIQNNSLCINLADKSSLVIITYNIQGKIISTIRKKLNSGIHSIKLPCTSSGVYFHKIKTGKIELVLKSNSIGNMSFGTGSSIKESPSITAANTSRSMEQIDDVIKSTKPGYLNYRVVITNLDTSGIEIKMISQDAGTITDVDGNLYHGIKIGNQVWTVENLRVTHYNDGTPISKITDNSEWENDSNGAYCYYYNDSLANAEKYGALYNWHAVNTGKLAPKGWHVPTNWEWTKLELYLIANGYNWDGTITRNKIGKSMAAKTDWNSSSYEGNVGNDLSTNNSTGFSALPGGYRGSSGGCYNIGNYGYWWSATENGASGAFCRILLHDGYSFFSLYEYKNGGCSVRFLRD